MPFFPIVLFTYNRPDHTRLTIDSLRRNHGAAESDLYIYSDGPKTDQQTMAVGQVRDYLRTVDGFRSVRLIERQHNMGLAASVIAGTTEVLDAHPACIVVEDDMLSAPTFLNFMNAALQTYRERTDIFSVTGYNYPLPIPPDYPADAYLSYRGSSWGWGTWTDRWRQVDWSVSDYASFAKNPREQALFARGGGDLAALLKLQMEGKIDSWSIRFDYAHYRRNAFCVHAARSKIQNIGFDGSGVHCGTSDEYKVELDTQDRAFSLPPDLAADPLILSIFDSHFRPAPGPVQPTGGILWRAAHKARKLARGLFAGA